MDCRTWFLKIWINYLRHWITSQFIKYQHVLYVLIRREILHIGFKYCRLDTNPFLSQLEWVPHRQQRYCYCWMLISARIILYFMWVIFIMHAHMLIWCPKPTFHCDIFTFRLAGKKKKKRLKYCSWRCSWSKALGLLHIFLK